jgi:hypothetical protein
MEGIFRRGEQNKYFVIGQCLSSNVPVTLLKTGIKILGLKFHTGIPVASYV